MHHWQTIQCLPGAGCVNNTAMNRRVDIFTRCWRHSLCVCAQKKDHRVMWQLYF
jgi:hypothetical protein